MNLNHLPTIGQLLWLSPPQPQPSPSQPLKKKIRNHPFEVLVTTPEGTRWEWRDPYGEPISAEKGEHRQGYSEDKTVSDSVLIRDYEIEKQGLIGGISNKEMGQGNMTMTLHPTVIQDHVRQQTLPTLRLMAAQSYQEIKDYGYSP